MQAENILITCDKEGWYNKGKEPAAGLCNLGSTLFQDSNRVAGATRVTKNPQTLSSHLLIRLAHVLNDSPLVREQYKGI